MRVSLSPSLSHACLLAYLPAVAVVVIKIHELPSLHSLFLPVPLFPASLLPKGAKERKTRVKIERRCCSQPPPLFLPLSFLLSSFILSFSRCLVASVHLTDCCVSLASFLSYLIPGFDLQLRETEDASQIRSIGGREVLLRVKSSFQSHQLQFREDSAIPSDFTHITSVLRPFYLFLLVTPTVTVADWLLLLLRLMMMVMVKGMLAPIDHRGCSGNSFRDDASQLKDLLQAYAAVRLLLLQQQAPVSE